MGNRDVVICRELTKIYESFIRGPVHEAIRTLEGQRIRGEITLLISGCLEAKPEWSDAALLQRFKQLRQDPLLFPSGLCGADCCRNGRTEKPGLQVDGHGMTQ